MVAIDYLRHTKTGEVKLEIKREVRSSQTNITDNFYAVCPECGRDIDIGSFYHKTKFSMLLKMILISLNTMNKGDCSSPHGDYLWDFRKIPRISNKN